jgi:hypothetical protein
MKWLKSTSIILLAMTLAACGHGFEGEYQSEAGSSIELMDVFAKSPVLRSLSSVKTLLIAKAIELNLKKSLFVSRVVTVTLFLRYR